MPRRGFRPHRAGCAFGLDTGPGADPFVNGVQRREIRDLQGQVMQADVLPAVEGGGGFRISRHRVSMTVPSEMNTAG